LRFVASSAANPRSRNTLPLERRIFVVIEPPASGHGDGAGRRDAFGPARSQPEASGASASRMRGARTRLLRISRRRNAMLHACVHANLDDPWPHGGHRLPVDRQEALLHPAELVASVAASVLGKRPEVLKRRARTRVSRARTSIYVFICRDQVA
jgi:hypothetical protein